VCVLGEEISMATNENDFVVRELGCIILLHVSKKEIHSPYATHIEVPVNETGKRNRCAFS
jgi:hypothetical protein